MFVCNVGVRQGENLSPLLFALYLNDFAKYMSQWYKGLQLFSNECYSQTSDDDKNKNDKNNKNVFGTVCFAFTQMIYCTGRDSSRIADCNLHDFF